MIEEKFSLYLLEKLIAELYELIYYTKEMYKGSPKKKLNDPMLQIKAYWFIRKMFYSYKKLCWFRLL